MQAMPSVAWKAKMQGMPMIYLDHAAATPMAEEVVQVMAEFATKRFGNPSSLHFFGQDAKAALAGARAEIAKILGCSPEEIIFTSSGTESINLAISGFAKKKGKGHIVTSAIEHAAVLNCCKELQKQGFEVSYVKPDSSGLVSPEKIAEAIRPNTILVSIGYANNEIGTIQRIAEIGKICKARGIAFHTDAVQAANYLDLDVERLNVDLLSISGAKIYGPKGTGLLFKRSSISLSPFIFGGGQEFGLKPGTENVAGWAGLATALKLAQSKREAESERLRRLQGRLIEGLSEIPKSRLNGCKEPRLPNNVNFSFYGIEGESLVLLLSETGICASTGSACSSAKLEPSHVLTAIGVPRELIHGSIRLTLGRTNDGKQIEAAIQAIKSCVERLRAISPLK